MITAIVILLLAFVPPTRRILFKVFSGALRALAVLFLVARDSSSRRR